MCIREKKSDFSLFSLEIKGNSAIVLLTFYSCRKENESYRMAVENCWYAPD